MKTTLLILVAFLSLNCFGQMMITGTVFNTKEAVETKQKPKKEDSLQVAKKQVKEMNKELKDFLKELKKDKEKKNLTSKK